MHEPPSRRHTQAWKVPIVSAATKLLVPLPKQEREISAQNGDVLQKSSTPKTGRELKTAICKLDVARAHPVVGITDLFQAGEPESEEHPLQNVHSSSKQERASFQTHVKTMSSDRPFLQLRCMDAQAH